MTTTTTATINTVM